MPRSLISYDLHVRVSGAWLPSKVTLVLVNEKKNLKNKRFKYTVAWVAFFSVTEKNLVLNKILINIIVIAFTY